MRIVTRPQEISDAAPNRTGVAHVYGKSRTQLDSGDAESHLMKHRIASYLAVAALAFAAQSAHAQVSLIGNFNAASSGSSVDFTNALYLSMRFTTGTTTLAVSAAQATLGGLDRKSVV